MRKRHGDRASVGGRAGHAGPSDRAERPPRLLGPGRYVPKSPADLIGIEPGRSRPAGAPGGPDGAEPSSKKPKEKVIDVLPEGVTEILHNKVHGPFIGEVEDGQTQTGLISNLFAAPMYRHESDPTDFLMVLGQLRETKTTGPLTADAMAGLGVALRPLPRNVYCVGQTQPRVKVFQPNTNDEKKFFRNFVAYHIAKTIERNELREGTGLRIDDVNDRLFVNTVLPAQQIRAIIKAVANCERQNNNYWALKQVGEDDFPGVEALGRRVNPEGIAAYESQQAAIQRYQDLGICELYSGTNNVGNVAVAMIYLNGMVQAAFQRRSRLKKLLDVKARQRDPRLVYYERAHAKLDGQYHDLKRKQSIAKFIYEELQLSPWNLSGDFIDVHKRAIRNQTMKLTGIGDPSGRGEAYSFLREEGGRGSKSSAAVDGALNAQIKKITGTENDLRKLTMKQMASLLQSYNVPSKDIEKLKRWDRVHVIRDLSTKNASDGMGDEMDRFARTEKTRLSDQRSNYKERIQEIWRRQTAALTATDIDAAAVGMEGKAKDAEAANEAGAEKADGPDDESEDDEELIQELEMDLANREETNRLASNLGQSGMTQEARNYALMMKGMEEERNLQDGGGQKLGAPGMPVRKFKVIRRKITKTKPDGSQVVSFELIVKDREKVEEIIAKKKEVESEEKKAPERKKKKKKPTGSYAEGACVGHAMFKDEDDAKRVKVKVLKTRGKPGPKKRADSKISSIKHSRLTVKERNAAKRMQRKEDEDMYKKKAISKGTNNRKERGAARDRMPHVILSDRLESIRMAVEDRPNVGAFLRPVDRGLYPHYYELINEPIDLNTIREKNRRYDYKRADSLISDFDLMKRNAVKFNGANSPLAKEAEEIYEFVKSTIEQNREEFDQMEEAVDDQMNGKKKRKAKAAGAKAKAESKASLNTASVMLDGVETKVNLGDNLTFGGLGFDDSDSDSD